jgi:ornithine cyclodeaminase/alanine dehydrogenase-like protein (mu-crystallin family)
MKSMQAQGTLLLNRSEIASLLTLDDYIEVVEQAFRLHAEGQSLSPGLLHVDSGDGEFHIKAGGLRLGQSQTPPARPGA